MSHTYSEFSGQTLDFYRERQAFEWPLTLSVLEALPADKMQYTPHPISPTAERIGLTILRCLKAAVDLTQASRVEMVFEEHVTQKGLTERYAALSQSLSSAVGTRDEAFWIEPCTVLANGEAILQMPRCDIMWLFHFDAIHHRGQLTTYLRPMGGSVPSTYGRSADGVPPKHR